MLLHAGQLRLLSRVEAGEGELVEKETCSEFSEFRDARAERAWVH